jgi:outer membrane receptor protein involved in Fe transport
MNRLLLLIFLLLSASVLLAQNRTEIKGNVLDSLSNTPIEFATVAILDARDTTSTLLSYTLTDKKGAFALHSLPAGVPLKAYISFVAYQPYRKYFTLSKGQVFDLSAVKMQPKQMKEVTIKGERMPVVIRKDTIEFDAEAFKTRPNAVVEDLLKKLPGVEVDNYGKITVMGKDVSKVLVDGHEFFTNDPRIATRNLDADMIAKVQVYDDREDDRDHLIPEVNVKKIINLKFKRALKKSIFGKAYAGKGTHDHYQTGGLLNMFRDTLQVSVLGNTNNLNNTGFNFNDLYTMGGLDRGGNAFNGLGLGLAPIGKQTATSAGININTDYGKKLKVNLAYLYSHTNTAFNTLTNRRQFINDTTATTQSESDHSNINNKYVLSGLLRWQPDENTQLKYSPMLDVTQQSGLGSNQSFSFSNFIDPINTDVNSSNAVNNRLGFQHAIEYYHAFVKKGESISISQNLQVNPATGDNFNKDSLQSYLSSFSSYLLNREIKSLDRNTDAGLTVNYRYPLTKALTFDIGASSDYDHQVNKASTYDFNPVTGLYDAFVALQSSDLTRNKWQQTLLPGITYDFKEGVSLMAYLGGLWQQVNNSFGRNTTDINKRYFNVTPNVSLNVKAFSINYSEGVQLPNIGDMVPYSVVFSPLYSVTGNPDLKPTVSNAFNIGYHKYDYQRGLMLGANISANFEQNSVFRERTLSADLAQTSTPINRNGRYYYHTGVSINKRFKKKSDFQISFATNANLSKNHNFFVLNNRNGYENSYSANFSQQISLNWKDIILVDPQYTLSKIYTAYSGVDYKNQSYLTHNIYTHFIVFWPHKTNFEGTYTYLYNPLVPAGIQKNTNLLNVSIARQFLKKDGVEIKLSCYDILNQNVSVSRTITENNVIDAQSQIIKRYFMLTLQYKFTKSIVKK